MKLKLKLKLYLFLKLKYHCILASSTIWRQITVICKTVPGWRRDPRIPIPPRTADHTRRSGSVACRSGSSWVFVRRHPDVGRRNTRWVLGHSWPEPQWDVTDVWPGSSWGWPCMSHDEYPPRWESHGDQRQPLHLPLTSPLTLTLTFDLSTSNTHTHRSWPRPQHITVSLCVSAAAQVSRLLVQVYLLDVVVILELRKSTNKF